jgi:ABC-type bacteriocin/lantibiotic exporter with double-glycine peptidase domain
MKPIKQEDGLGCAVACIAFVLNIKYQKALTLFKNGERRVNKEANFYCPELVNILNSFGLKYRYKKLKKNNESKIYKEKSIVFIKRSKKYPYGHFLSRYNGFWMDPWINLPNKNIKAGFRKRLPERPTYVILRLAPRDRRR